MIELRDVSKTVQSGSEPLTILHPLSLTVGRGQFLAIVGPSGSGKSTLLGLIAGLDAPSSGSVLIDGVDITRLDEDGLARLRGEKIGFVFQFFHLIPSLTAYENVAVPMEIAGAANPRRAAEQLLEEVGLTGRSHHYPTQLSGGEQQRVALARALANDPPLVLADEPTGNLDSANGRHILELLRTIHRSRGTTIVLVTHDIDLAAIADQRLVLRDGRVVEDVGADCVSAPGGPIGPPLQHLMTPGRTHRSDFGRTLRSAPTGHHAIRSPHGRPRNALVLAAPAVLLHLHRRRRGRDRRAALGDSERP